MGCCSKSRREERGTREPDRDAVGQAQRAFPQAGRTHLRLRPTSPSRCTDFQKNQLGFAEKQQPGALAPDPLKGQEFKTQEARL